MTEIRIQAGKVTEIPLGKLKPDPANPRRSFDETALMDLAENIRARGILQPLTIRKHGKGLMIVHGERRWRAARLARLKTVPCLLSAVDDDAVTRGIDQVAENTARANLAPMDLARWLAGLKASEKLSPNEIAARLDKAGLKAMTRAQVDDLIRLTELPAWAQGMVDAGQMEASAAGQLLKLKDLPAGAGKVAAAVIADRVKWSGKATAKEVAGAIWDGIRDIAAADLTHTSYTTNPVLFAWKTRCKLGDGKSDCPHLVKHAGGAWCIDEVLFAKHQAEAKAAGLGPGGKRVHKEKRDADGKGADGDDGQAEKAEQRERSLTEKVRDYLHAYLVRELAVAVEETAQLQQALVLWAALKKPGSGQSARRLIIPGLKAPEHDITQLEELTEGDEAHADARRAAAIAILFELPWRETHAFARQRWGDDLQSVWGLDAGFLDLFRKAELARLAEVHGCALPEGRKSWAAMKGSEIKEALLGQAEKLTHPAILVALYSGPIEAPYKPWSPDDEDDDGTDDGVDWEAGDETGAGTDLEDAA